MMISFADSGKIFDSIVICEIVVGLVKPFSFLHFLKGVCVLIRVMLNHRFQLPDLRTVYFWFITKKNIDLSLSGFVFEIIVKVALQGSEQLKPTLCCFLYFLLMGQTAAILNRYQISHLLIKLRIGRQNPIMTQ